MHRGLSEIFGFEVHCVAVTAGSELHMLCIYICVSTFSYVQPLCADSKTQPDIIVGYREHS